MNRLEAEKRLCIYQWRILELSERQYAHRKANPDYQAHTMPAPIRTTVIAALMQDHSELMRATYGV